MRLHPLRPSSSCISFTKLKSFSISRRDLLPLCFLLRVPPSMAVLLSLPGLHRRPSVRT